MGAQATALSTARKLGLGVGDLGFNLYWQSTSLFLLFFYTDVLGIPAEIAGLIYMLALVWDAAIDPLIGLIADRTRTRIGRYRPYLLFGSPVLALAFVLMFASPREPAAGAVMLTAAAHVLFRTVYAVVSIPYSSLFARVTRDSAERADLAGFRMVFATLSALVISAGTLPLTHILGGSDPRRGWIALGAIFGIAGTLIIVLVAWAARGLDGVDAPAPQRRPASAVAGSILANTPLLITLGVILVTSFSSVFFQKNVIYYFKYVVGDVGAASTALAMMAGLTALAVPFWAWVARSRGKRPAWIAGGGFSIAGLVLWRLADGHGLATLLGALAVMSIGTAASYVCFWAIVPDTVEYGEWRTGVRTESFVFGFVTLAQKAALGFGAGGLGFALKAVGYAANKPQSAATLSGLKTLMLAVPLTGVVIAVVLMLFYRLDPKTHRRLVDEIAARELDSPITPAI
ncbi:MAG TPA: glycoside-pentoside-hexuronide (GPH):cation symporter [Caulobacteraceae bacterium]|jgi:GPH family glycoside/pentoside/hexuronide:cation symporter|nr:glycoside-pentoside-hexuronide (GPH):cation symporter [Caulobacteraceae bacterium]